MTGNMIARHFALMAVVFCYLGGGAAFAQSKVQAGVSAAVRGQIQIASLDAAVGNLAKSGDGIYLGDKITSGENSGMQVLLMDETVFTIGAQSAIAIDEFVYDPETEGGKVAPQVVKGAFRFVTGRIANRRPTAMSVKLPVGSIGVRGTIAAGRVDGNSSLVVLLGPGTNTDTDERIGRILVSNAGETVEISRAGFATTIDGPNAVPIEPFQLPLADLKALTQSLDQNAAPRQDGGNSESGTRRASSQGGNGDQKQAKTAPRQTQGVQAKNDNAGGQQASASKSRSPSGQLNVGTAGSLAGEDQASANQSANDPLNTSDAREEGDKLLNDATQGDPETQLPTVSAGLATFEEIRRIQTGMHSFTIDTAFVQTQMNGMASNLPGDMKVRLDIDFGARTLGGGGSRLALDTTTGGGNINIDAQIPIKDYSKDTGFASKVYGNGAADPPEVKGSRFEILNGNGVIAQTLQADVKFDDGLGNQGTGAGQSANRKN
jgi:hypothetical protein